MILSGRLARWGVLIVLLLLAPRAYAADPLPSWAEGPSKKAVLDFVARVTQEGGPDYVAPAERIATFDNDGTLWAEQPLYFQFLFALDRVKQLAPAHPEWKDKEPFASLLKGDVKAALAQGDKALLEIVAATHAGITTGEFEQVVDSWFASAKHPKLKRPYTQLVYQPMLELLAFLREKGFKTFIVSGGGVEFMRSFAAKVYGIPPEQVIGSFGKQKYQMRGDQPSLLKMSQVDFIDDGPGKPVGIQRFIGRRPIAAFGNSDGDREMLEWTTAGKGARFALLVHHTDGAREYAYDRESAIGKLAAALDQAKQKGWTVVSMKDDWKTILPP
jgi:phosphoglycolate phosphatase-like HAD superfamily hydrolase